MKIQSNLLFLDTKNIEQIKFIPERKVITHTWIMEPFMILGQMGKKADGCIFTIYGRNAIWIMRNKKDIYFQETVIAGKAYLMICSPDNKVKIYDFDEEKHGQSVKHGGKNSTNVWIAKNKGAKILNITEPKFSPDSEEQIPIDDQSLPEKFWSNYHRLKDNKEI